MSLLILMFSINSLEKLFTIHCPIKCYFSFNHVSYKNYNERSLTLQLAFHCRRRQAQVEIKAAVIWSTNKTCQLNGCLLVNNHSVWLSLNIFTLVFVEETRTQIWGCCWKDFKCLCCLYLYYAFSLPQLWALKRRELLWMYKSPW